MIAAAQYVSIRYSERLMDVGAAASADSVTDSYDNAMAEALNGTPKAEVIEHQGPWRDAGQVERAVMQWVGWYNTERLHSALGHLPPEEFEAAYQRSMTTPNAA
ncbi:integrase core domain-containing protein [Streptomyces sp. NPDC007896]|uniref:integrase core domain-containing protein n=1 Tax=Streptomyces sp. NPDC007896 TaxID=3364784 RepID=UPI0036ED22A6